MSVVRPTRLTKPVPMRTRLVLADEDGEPVVFGPDDLGGVTDHGALTGLADDDHTQYATNTEFDDHNARHQPGGADPMAVDAAAATGSLRTIGSGALQAAAGDHAHDAGGMWVPVMTEDPDSGNWFVVVTGDGDAVMTEVS